MVEISLEGNITVRRLLYLNVTNLVTMVFISLIWGESYMVCQPIFISKTVTKCDPYSLFTVLSIIGKKCGLCTGIGVRRK